MTRGAGAASSAAPPAREAVGAYEVLSTLGSGGQGVVYRARHRETGQEVALKVPHADVAERVLKEARILARLDHPRIVRLLDSGHAGGVPFLATELCRGGSLAERLAAAPIGDADRHNLAFRVAEGVLEALAYAHAQGVIHRDLKPANILFDERGGAKVADFGIGKLSLAAAGAGEPLAQSVARSAAAPGSTTTAAAGLQLPARAGRAARLRIANCGLRIDPGRAAACDEDRE